MPKVIILGTANSIPDRDHENTHLLVKSADRTVLVDCVGSPIVRLRQANIEPGSLTDLILTHIHPDHIYGVPLLLMDMWLLGRKDKLVIHGLGYTLDRVRGMMDLYGWDQWPNFFPVEFHPVPEEEMVPVIESEDLRIFSSKVKHLVPTIGVRFEFPGVNRAVAYSCDTEPCQEVVRLAANVDVLLHESTGASRGHTSAEQAGEIAREAGARQLYLIHYRTDQGDPLSLVAEAQKTFPGQVVLARDFMEIDY